MNYKYSVVNYKTTLRAFDSGRIFLIFWNKKFNYEDFDFKFVYSLDKFRTSVMDTDDNFFDVLVYFL